ncbi:TRANSCRIPTION FACTOR PDR1-RELATED [Ceraceosorus bombacis]|uniref:TRANSCRIPTION FACTOR PDR1-RELATED n=1 Tax=Ceraceosorus bombacis TaxID=401625 RepID=A0A0P1BRH0_9BASI|nr:TRANSCRIPTION FACTOR PDR1-RELATED [Ceraceosorus bombacis]
MAQPGSSGFANFAHPQYSGLGQGQPDGRDQQHGQDQTSGGAFPNPGPSYDYGGPHFGAHSAVSADPYSYGVIATNPYPGSPLHQQQQQQMYQNHINMLGSIPQGPSSGSENAAAGSSQGPTSSKKKTKNGHARNASDANESARPAVVEDGEDEDADGKRRRVQRACDSCRKKKVKCNGLGQGETKCTNCATYGHECTFLDAAKRRPPPRAYVDALEARMDRMEELLTQLAPGVDYSERQALNGTSLCADASEVEKRRIGEVHWTSIKDERLQWLSARGVPGPDGPPQGVTSQFLGKASDFHLIDLLDRMSRDDQRLQQRGIWGEANAMKSAKDPDGYDFFTPSAATQQLSEQELDALDWPEPDLEKKLIDAYFKRPHLDYPMINELKFRHDFDNRPDMRRRPDFVALCLGLFAVASRYVDDSRVCLNPNERAGGETYHTAGLQWWLAQRHIGQRVFGGIATLEHAQNIVLATIFMLGTPMANTLAWAVLSVAVRLLQDVGAHRKVTAQRLKHPLLLTETYRRLWWVTYSLDREFSAGLGRPVCIQDEDFDVDEPLAVDDMFLIDAAATGNPPSQPVEKPSLLAGFVASIRLDQIIGRTLRTIYAIGKAKVSRGFVGRQWDQFIVAEIDSSLNQWLGTVPQHLKYNANEPNDEWLLQSSLLHTKYYHSQILVHRPFIPGPNSKSSLNYPSLAICTNAARSICHILHNLYRRKLHPRGGLQVLFRAFSAGCILLLVVWSAKRSGARTSTSTMADVRRCLDVLRGLEKHWSLACKMSRLMDHLIAVSELPVPRSALKRPHKTGSGGDASDNEEGSFESSSSRRKIKSSGDSRRTLNVSSSSSSVGEPVPLPLSTSELMTAFADSQADSPATSAAGKVTSPAPHSAGATSLAEPSASADRWSATSAGAASAQGEAPPTQRNPQQLLDSQLGAGAFQQFLQSSGDVPSSGLTPFLGPGSLASGAAGSAASPGMPFLGQESSFNAPTGFTPQLSGSAFDPASMMDGGNTSDPFEQLFAQQHLWAEEWMPAFQQQNEAGADST